MRIYSAKDVDQKALKGATIAIVGYGSQGRAHALNLKDSGFNVVIGARKGGASWKKAQKDGLKVAEPIDAVVGASLVALLTPDMAQAAVYNEIKGPLATGAALLALATAHIDALPLPDAAVELVFCSLLLPWIADPDALFAEVRRVLEPGGLFAFATLGPDTLHELRAASRVVDDTPRVLEFTDMPELARGLQQAGFADPVLDRDLHQLSYSGPDALFADLRALGATNRRRDRANRLTGRGRLAHLRQACAAFRDADGRLPVTCEVVYGHAWVPDGEPVRHRRGAPGATAGEVVVPLSGLRRPRGGTP